MLLFVGCSTSQQHAIVYLRGGAAAASVLAVEAVISKPHRLEMDKTTIFIARFGSVGINRFGGEGGGGGLGSTFQQQIKCILRTDLLRQLYELPHWSRSS